MDSIWWTKITNASGFLDSIVNTIQDNQSVILQLSDSIPWYTTMRNIVESELFKRNSMSSYKSIVDPVMDPGEYLFNEFCKKEKRAHYRPGFGYAEFLAKSEDIVLNECILWVSEIDYDQVMKWWSFIECYNKALGKQKRGCLFLIETHADINLQEKKGVKKISYEKEIEHYDNYLFNLIAASSLNEKEYFKQYIAEAVSNMFPEDIELSSSCISYGRQFLNEPLQVVKSIVDSKHRSDGARFVLKNTDSELQKRLWEAQVKVIFPLLEKHKNIIVQKYYQEIEKLLPISTAFGEVFEEVNNIELGDNFLYSSFRKNKNVV